MAWTRRGLRYRKVRSRGSRFGDPKVHVEIYHPGVRLWWHLCSNEDPNPFGMGWAVVPDDEEVTCKLCLRAERLWRKRGT